MKKKLPLVAALFAAAASALADLYATLTVNGTPYDQGGAGWTFDGATVSLTNAGPFVLSTGGANFTSNVAVVAQADCAVTFSNLEVFAGNHAGLSPFTVAPGVSVALTLEGNTVLTAGSGPAPTAACPCPATSRSAGASAVFCGSASA